MEPGTKHFDTFIEAAMLSCLPSCGLCVCVRDCVLKDVCLSYTTGKVQYVFNSVNSCSSTDASQKARSQLVITATVIRGLFPAEASKKEPTSFLGFFVCLIFLDRKCVHLSLPADFSTSPCRFFRTSGGICALTAVCILCKPSSVIIIIKPVMHH